MIEPDFRWKQRLNNYNKVIKLLADSLKIENPDIVQKAGIIKFFKISFELACNTMKDFLFEQGYTDIKSPRGAIKQAFEAGLISDGHIWVKALEDRNLTVHIYDEAIVDEILAGVRNEYFLMLNKFLERIKSER